jgi:hypothetical protein
MLLSSLVAHNHEEVRALPLPVDRLNGDDHRFPHQGRHDGRFVGQQSHHLLSVFAQVDILARRHPLFDVGQGERRAEGPPRDDIAQIWRLQVCGLLLALGGCLLVPGKRLAHRGTCALRGRPCRRRAARNAIAVEAQEPVGDRLIDQGLQLRVIHAEGCAPARPRHGAGEDLAEAPA